MTVCIAAVCNVGSSLLETAIVATADRMITIGDIEYEPEQTKIIDLASQTIVLLAGDMSLHAHVVPKVRQRVRDALHTNPVNVDVADIAEMYAEEFAYYRRVRAEREILFPRGLNFDRYLLRQKDMAHYQVKELDSRLASYFINSTAIVVGLDPKGGHIFKIEDPGIAENWNTPYFACAGSGKELASTQFMVSGFEKRWSLARTVWLAFSAKARAGSAGGVGQQTDLVIVRYGGSITAATPEDKKHLEEFFAKVREKELAAAGEAEMRVDAYLRDLERKQPRKPDQQQAAPAKEETADPQVEEEPKARTGSGE